MKNNLNKFIYIISVLILLLILILGCLNIITKEISLVISIFISFSLIVLSMLYYKKKKNKLLYSLLIPGLMQVIIIIFLIFGNFFTPNYSEITSISIKETQNCEAPVLYHSDNLYSKCLDNIELEYNDGFKEELKDSLKKNRISLDKLFLYSYTHYYYETEDSSVYIYDEFEIIKCSKKTNKIIIGQNLNINEGYCQEENQS